MPARSLAVVGAVMIVAGGAVIGYAVTRKPEGNISPEATEAMTKATSQIDSDIKQAHANARERAGTLAMLSYVRKAVQTDLTTAKQMVIDGELKFEPREGEVIEIGQLAAGAPKWFVVEPDNGMRSSHSGNAGSYAELIGDHLLITEVAEAKDNGKVLGYVTVSRPLDLKPAIAALVAAKLNGELTLAGKSVAVGSPATAKDETRVMALASEPGAQLVVVVPPATGGIPTGALGAGVGAAVLGLLLVGIGMMGGKREPREGTAPGLAPQSLATAHTQLSAQHLAVGTPSVTGVASDSLINPSNLGPGAMIGRWEVVRRLGSGGMADVYLSRARGEAGFEKLVALKIMHGHLARNQRAVEHFLDEARLAARVVHPNVVAIQDLGKIGNDFVIVMEYVDGVDLERLLMSSRAGGRLVPLDVGMGTLCRICDGLNAAHRATAPDGSPLGIIHRDVKSANVLVSRQGGVKVVDFGIAKAATQSHLTVAGETKGTPSMMAPEQRVGERVDVRADVYSVAAVAYEVLTGNGVNLDLAALAHLGVENWPHLPAPSSLRKDLPPELDEILLTAMAFERDKRPADCLAFEATLAEIMKRHQLVCSDKDIARWVESELKFVQPIAEGGADTVARPI